MRSKRYACKKYARLKPKLPTQNGELIIFPSLVIKTIFVIFLAYFFLVIYLFCTLYIGLYCFVQLHLLYHYLRSNRPDSQSLSFDDLPVVTVQLPIFNERYVVNRLIDCVAAFDYPKDKLQIQLLDDSTDDTLQMSEAKAAFWREQGFDITVHHRTDRTGYKAGALRAGLSTAKGLFVAIFDADFLPSANFLKTMLPDLIRNERVAVVQARWEHINRNYSLLTELQALQLDVHFTIEQQGRQSGGFFRQFNGTAGVWRVTAIADAGGWHDDTLTEDLDLSYRAQLRGWQVVFKEEVGAPAELPVEMNGLKSQQFRWMKGGAENARKLLGIIWQAPITIPEKLHATGHLLNSGVFLVLFILSIVSIPLIYLQPLTVFDAKALSLFLSGLVATVLLYFVGNTRHDNYKGWRTARLLLLFPVFLTYCMGLSRHNAVAVWQGYTGRKSPFVRTPKFGISAKRDRFRSMLYMTKQASTVVYLEGLLSLIFGAAAVYGIVVGNFVFVLLHVMLFAGYGLIFFHSLRDTSAAAAS